MTEAWPDARKIAELRAKLASLEEEFGHWRAESDEDRPLRKHHTQIENVTGALNVLRLRIVDELDALAGGAPLAGRTVVDVETMILDVHRIWEFFRSKLSQRFVQWFQPFLVAADEFAWDCYDPMRNAIDPAYIPAADVREPPMVFFNGGWSPFTMSRGVDYEAEYVPEEDLDKDRYQTILKDLPFPVIGVPWYQVRHLPDAVLLGHEVGHAVEDDFKLTSGLRSLLAAAFETGDVPKEQQPGWSSWLGEIFADMYGTLAAGEAFASALMDLVSGPVDQITKEQADPRAWGEYPPAALRVDLTLAALAESGFARESAALRTRWAGIYPVDEIGDFNRYSAPIVAALLRGPMKALKNSRGLIEVFSFAASAGVAATRDRLEQNLALDTSAARTLLSTARLEFDASPEAYVANGIQQKILDAISVGQDKNTRGRAAEILAPRERDKELGERLFTSLAGLRS